jgi:hypothetical protein
MPFPALLRASLGLSFRRRSRAFEARRIFEALLSQFNIK